MLLLFCLFIRLNLVLMISYDLDLSDGMLIKECIIILVSCSQHSYISGTFWFYADANALVLGTINKL